MGTTQYCQEVEFNNTTNYVQYVHHNTTSLTMQMGSSVLVTLCCCSSVAGDVVAISMISDADAVDVGTDVDDSALGTVVVGSVVVDVDAKDVNSGVVNIVVDGINVVGDVGVVFSWSSKCRWDSLVIKSTSLKFNK